MATVKVLVVDDEPAVLSLVCKALSAQGYEVHAVSGPRQALELMQTAPCFDLVVSDVIMPENEEDLTEARIKLGRIARTVIPLEV